jgi:hypothetical protein
MLIDDFPKKDISVLGELNYRNHRITSLRGLPPVFYDHIGKVYMDFRDNFLENLDGLSYLHFHAGYDEYTQDTFRSPELLIAGNPLRSLYGVPLLGFHHFLERFHRKIARIPNSMTPEGVKVYYSDSRFSIDKRYEENPPYFLLTLTGAALLDAFISEDKRYKSQRSQQLSNEIDPEELLSKYWSEREDPDSIPLRSPSAQSLLEDEVNRRLALFRPEIGSRAWLRAYNALFDYYRLSPEELARQYIKHCTSGSIIPKETIGRLKHEGGPIERIY